MQKQAAVQPIHYLRLPNIPLPKYTYFVISWCSKYCRNTMISVIIQRSSQTNEKAKSVHDHIIYPSQFTLNYSTSQYVKNKVGGGKCCSRVFRHLVYTFTMYYYNWARERGKVANNLWALQNSKNATDRPNIGWKEYKFTKYLLSVMVFDWARSQFRNLV